MTNRMTASMQCKYRVQEYNIWSFRITFLWTIYLVIEQDVRYSNKSTGETTIWKKLHTEIELFNHNMNNGKSEKIYIIPDGCEILGRLILPPLNVND